MTDLSSQIEDGGLTSCDIEPLLTKVILDIYHLFDNITFHLKFFTHSKFQPKVDGKMAQ